MVLSGNKETLGLFSIQRLTRYKITRRLHHVYVDVVNVVSGTLIVLVVGSAQYLLFSYSAVVGVCCSHVRQCSVFVVIMFGSVRCLSCSCSEVFGVCRAPLRQCLVFVAPNFKYIPCWAP